MSMTLLQIASAIATDVGLAIPIAVATATDDTDRTMVEMKYTLDQTGEELARRVDWSALRATVTVTGDGTALTHALPASFLRMIAGQAVTSGTAVIRGGISAEEFLSLPVVAAGIPRFYLVQGKTIRFWPHLSNGIGATINYQNSWWNTTSDAYVADSDIALLPSPLMIKGGIARWRRQKGMDYPDYAAEYEAAIENFAAFDDNARSP